MADHPNVASWLISIGVDSASPSLDTLKGQFQAAANDIQRITSNIAVFSGLEDKVKSAADALAAAKVNVVAYSNALAAAGDAGKDVTGPLQQSLAAAQKAVITATAAYNTQVEALSKLENSLAAAGVSTSDLAVTQAKYTAATLAVTDALKLQNAQQTLGLVTTKSIAPELDKLNAALAITKAGFAAGTISSAELTQAELLFAQQTAKVEASVTNLPGLLERTGTAGKSAFEAMGGPTLLAIAGIAGVVEGVKGAIDASTAFADGLAKVGSITNLTGTQLDALGEQARKLSVTLGVDMTQALNTLYQILRSTNLGPDDAITVLDASARAAKASFSDLGTVAGISTTLVSAFGLKANEVAGALDTLFASAKAGGPTFNDLSGGIGKLSVSAEASGLSVQQMSAFLNVMTQASGDGAGAVTALNQILIKFNTDKVREQLRDMGIDTTNAADAIQQLTDRGDVNLNKLLDLGIATGKTAAGVVALTSSSNNLADALTRAASATGDVADGLKKIEDSPTENVAKLTASLKDLGSQSGIITLFNAYITLLTGITNETANNIAAMKAQRAATVDLQAPFQDMYVDVSNNAEAQQLLSFNVGQTADALRKFRQEEDQGFGKGLTQDAQALNVALADVDKDIATVQKSLEGIATLVQQDIQLLNTEAKGQEDQVTLLADTQIAALDRSVKAQLATAAQTVAIQTKAAADRLAIIQQNELDVNVAVEGALEVREAQLEKDLAGTLTALRAQGKSQVEIDQATEDGITKIEAQLANIRIAAIQPTIAAYQKLYTDLVAQEQGYATKLESIGKEKLASQQSIALQLINLRINAVDATGKAILSSYDQQVAKATEAESLISLARAAADKGDVELAQKYATQAIGISNTITAVEETAGNAAISQQVVQITQARILTETNNLLGTAYDNQAKAAKTGLTSTNEAIATVKEKLDSVLVVQKQMQDTAAAGLQVKLSFDEKSVLDYQQKLEGYTANRTVIITLKTVDSSGNPVAFPSGNPDFVGPPSPPGLASGGWVSKLARGGGVGDIVPAMLDPREFVLQPSAVDGISRMFGGGFLDALNRFASGGTVFDGTNADSSTVKDGFGEVKQALQYILDRTGIGAWDIVDVPQRVQYAPPGDDGTSNEAFLDDSIQLMSALQGLLRYHGIDAASAPLAQSSGTSFDGTNVTVGVVNEGLGEIEVALQHLLDESGFKFKVNSGVSGSGSTILNTLQEVMGGLQFYIKSRGWNDSSIPGFAGGGYAQKGIQGFATGGFAVPNWMKVPGSGDGDTVPARLRLGSFVVKKSASGLYGDGLMGTLARFADGGLVNDGGGEYDQSRFPTLVKLNTSTSTVDAAAEHKLKVYADALTTTLMTLGLNLPPPVFGQSLVSYLFNLKETIDSTQDGSTVQAMVSALDDNVESYKNAFAAGRLFHTGVAVGINADPIKLDPTTAAAVPAAVTQTTQIPQKKAMGGPIGTDTIPALLTPGEWVINPPAVQNISRLFGGGFLSAVNNMQIAPDFLERAMTPPQPRRYATGGYVDGPGAPALSTSVKGRSGQEVHVHFHADKMDAAEVRRTVIPEINKILRAAK